ncbi:MAG: formate dehydrogenase accessory protein FdhE [Deltaproteobacteria bacterium]|nr:formate dehydrogenase accessory protein FdhE [Deltaproteobacteria bacterium]
MNSGEGRASALEEAMEDLIEKKSYCTDVIRAFRAAIIARNRLVERLELDRMEPWKPDEIKFRGGLPIIRQHGLFLEKDPWKEIADAMIPALQEGLPHLRNDLERLRTCLDNGSIDLFDYFKAYADEPETLLGQWAALCDADPLSVGLFLNDAARIILAIRAKEMAPVIEGLLWEKGYCPVCSAFPMLSVIGDKGQRRLHCSLCGHEWRFKRTLCPFCEYEGQAGMTYFYVENEKNESVFACERCGRYLPTINVADALTGFNSDLAAIGLIHLDFIMQEQGFQPMAPCVWNRF